MPKADVSVLNDTICLGFDMRMAVPGTRLMLASALLMLNARGAGPRTVSLANESELTQALIAEGD
jgi:hypothetical protein